MAALEQTLTSAEAWSWWHYDGVEPCSSTSDGDGVGLGVKQAEPERPGAGAEPVVDDDRGGGRGDEDAGRGHADGDPCSLPTTRSQLTARTRGAIADGATPRPVERGNRLKAASPWADARSAEEDGVVSWRRSSGISAFGFRLTPPPSTLNVVARLICSGSYR